MLCIGEAHRVQLINLPVDHGKGSMEIQSAQEMKLQKVALQRECHILKTTPLSLNAAVFTAGPQTLWAK